MLCAATESVLRPQRTCMNIQATSIRYLTSLLLIRQQTRPPRYNSVTRIMSSSDIFLGLIAVLFPPIAGKPLTIILIIAATNNILVWIKSGLCSADSFINILLCVLGYLPGLLHAWYIIAKHPEYDYEAVPDDEAQGGRVTYYYVSHQSGRPQGQQNQNYGTSGQTPAATKNNRPVAPPPASTVSGPSTGAGASEAGAPPSYADAVKGDHKIQRQE